MEFETSCIDKIDKMVTTCLSRGTQVWHLKEGLLKQTKHCGDEAWSVLTLGAAVFDTHHLVDVNRQLPNHHTEPLELLKHAGQVLAREATDILKV